MPTSKGVRKGAPNAAGTAGGKTTVRKSRTVTHTIPVPAAPRPRAAAATSAASTPRRRPASAQPQTNWPLVAAIVIGLGLTVGGGAIGYGLMNQPQPKTQTATAPTPAPAPTALPPADPNKQGSASVEVARKCFVGLGLNEAFGEFSFPVVDGRQKATLSTPAAMKLNAAGKLDQAKACTG